MDIDLLSKMVKEVVMDHDSVTLPGVGSFVTELVPATFADRGYTILPPYRRLYFSPKQGEDRLLADLYATSNHISEADATRILEDFLAEMKDVLKLKKTIIFPGLGRLRATRENHFFFVADEDLDIYPSGFGLEPVSLKTHQETKEEVEQAVATLAGILEQKPVPTPVEAVPAEEEVSTLEAVAEESAVEVASAPEVAEVEAVSTPVVDAEEAVSMPEVAVAAEVPVEEAVSTPEEAAEGESGLDDVLDIEPAIEEVPAELIPELEVAPAAEPEAMPVTEFEPFAEPVAEPAAEPVAAPEVAKPAQVVEPAATPAAEPAAAVAAAAEPASAKKAGGRFWKGVGIALLVLLGIVLLAALAIAVVGRVAPEWLDQFLYSADELDILRK